MATKETKAVVIGRRESFMIQRETETERPRFFGSGIVYHVNGGDVGLEVRGEGNE